LREEITTLAPCSAIRSAIARPMPRVEPVMTATFPVMSNKLMFLSLLSLVIGSSKLRCHHLRPRRLVHGPVRGIGNPRLLVDHRQPPALAVRRCEMIEPRHRAIVDIEGKTLFDPSAKRETDRRLDRAAVTHGDDVLAGFAAGDLLDRAGRAIVEIH